MECPICKEDVWILNPTKKGLVCILCVWKYKLKLKKPNKKFSQEKDSYLYSEFKSIQEVKNGTKI